MPIRSQLSRPVRLLVLSCVMASPLLIRAQPVPPPPTVPTSGLVAYWPGDGSPADLVGRHNGAPYGDVSYVPVLGRKGFRFQGRNSGIFVPDFAALKLSRSLTLSVWINPESVDKDLGSQILFRGDDRPGLDPYTLCLLQANGERPRIQFAINGRTQWDIQPIAAYVTLNRLTHVAATLDDTTGVMRIYLNGQVSAQTVTPIRPLEDLDPGQNPGLGIGNTQNPRLYTEPFHGIIADLRIYKRALSPTEIRILYHHGKH